MTNEEYGQRLRDLRGELGLSLREVEERGGPSKDVLSPIERGLHKPRTQTLGRIAQAFGMSVSELRATLEADPPKAPEPLSLEWALDPRVGDEEFRATTAEASDEIIRELERQLFQQYQRAPNDRAWATGKPPKLRTPLVKERLRALRQPPYAVISWRGVGPAEVRWLIPEDEREALRPEIEEELKGEDYIEIGPGDPATADVPPEKSTVLV